VNTCRTQPPWEFLLPASRNTLQSYELSRLGHAANLRKEISSLLDQLLDENANAMIARWLIFLSRPFSSTKNKKRPDLSERFFNFNFLSSNYFQTFCIAGNSPLVFSSICSFRYTSELMSYVASSNPCPCVIASVGQASTQYPQKMQRE
jgi:hypothetical protein